MPIPKKLMTTSRKELPKVISQFSAVYVTGALPVCHNHRSILKSLLERVIPRTLFVILSLLQHGELLVKVPIDEGKDEMKALHEPDCYFKDIIAEYKIGEVVPYALYVPLRLLASV
ncbi:MAG: hypothetical protein Q9195_003362 [Heterodermia aff. obscurata]